VQWFIGYENPLPVQRFEYAFADIFAWEDVPKPSAAAVGDLTNAVTNLFQVSFSTIRSRGLGYYNQGGVSVTPGMRTEWSRRLDNPLYANAELTLGVRAPRLLPFINPNGLTLNMPLLLQASLFPTRTDFVSAGATVVPFSLEIQKGILWSAFFVKRVSLTASYNASFFRENESWDIARTIDIARDGGLPFRDNVTLSLFAVTGSNTAIFTQFPFEVGVDFVWNFHRIANDKPFEGKFRFKAAF
jgi:hypothetical protein